MAPEAALFANHGLHLTAQRLNHLVLRIFAKFDALHPTRLRQRAARLFAQFKGRGQRGLRFRGRIFRKLRTDVFKPGKILNNTNRFQPVGRGFLPNVRSQIIYKRQQELLDILAAGIEPDMSQKHARRRRGSGRKTAVRPVRFAPFGDDFSRAGQFRDGCMRRGLIRDIWLHWNGIRRRLHALETPLRTALPAHPLDAQQLVDALRDVVAGDDLSATFHKCIQFL